MANPDVIVIGAGLAGLALAWRLAPHRRLLILEQGEQPGAEASAQNAGMARRLGEDPTERALALRTAALLDDPGEDFAEAPPSRVTGALLGLAWDRHHLSDGVAHLRARGVRVEACDRPADVAPALRGSPLAFAWYLPDERVADAHALCSGFLRGARRHGASLRCGVRVHRLLVGQGRVRGVATDAGDLFADAVVLAAGAWCARLAAEAGLHRPIIPVRRTLLQTEAHPLARPEHPWTWIDDVGLYARPEAGGWLLSGCDEAVDRAPEGGGSQGPVEPLPRALALDKRATWMPALAGAAIRGGWTGLRSFAPDRAPVLGEDPALPGLWWVAGLGGFGVSCGAAAGEAVAAWMRGEATPWLHAPPCAPGRALPGRWPIRPTGSLDRSRLVPAAEGR